jgi:hypothetical protein
VAQADLDTVAACASAAINSPAHATMPADFAAAHNKRYPLSQPPPRAPKALPSAPPMPSTVTVPALAHPSAFHHEFTNQVRDGMQPNSPH